MIPSSSFLVLRNLANRPKAMMVKRPIATSIIVVKKPPWKKPPTYVWRYELFRYSW